jgi:hypothetical protein
MQVTLTLSVEQVNFILEGCHNLPKKIADPLIEEILKQGNSQVGKTPIPSPEAPVDTQPIAE